MEKIFSGIEALETHHELEDVFSQAALEDAARSNTILQEKIDTLVTISELYKKDIELIEDAQKNGVDVQGLLTRQHETHDQFIETLYEVRDQARICGYESLASIPDSISRPESGRIALFIAHEYEKNNQ